MVFEKAPISIPSILKVALYWFNLYYNADPQLFLLQQDSSPFHQLEEPTWSPPPANHIKINVDAAVSDNNSFAAAVARNNQGGFVGAGTNDFNTTNPLVGETHGFLLAIQLANRLKAHNVIIEGEINTIPWRIAHLIDEINSKVASINSVEFQFVKRRVNNVAHNLAKFAIQHNVRDWSLVDIFSTPQLHSTDFSF